MQYLISEAEFRLEKYILKCFYLKPRQVQNQFTLGLPKIIQHLWRQVQPYALYYNQKIISCFWQRKKINWKHYEKYCLTMQKEFSIAL